MSKTKCVVIREELVALTGDYKKAIVLGQLIYWSERVRDCRLFVEEEKERGGTYTYGWFYKRAEDLVEETMMGVKPKAMREYVKVLVEEGWLDERRNPLDKMDRTLQYRVNLVSIRNDLKALGYSGERCTAHPFLAMGHNEGATSWVEVSKCVKETHATDEKENTSISKSLESQGLQAMKVRVCRIRE